MAEGRVSQIIGTVVDVEFPPDQLPELFNAVNIYMEGPGAAEHAGEVGSAEASQANMIVAEVQQHLGNNWVRTLAMTSTDGLHRGARAVDTGSAISVPVGEKTLGRLFNVLGDPLDNLGAMTGVQRSPIHRSPPSFDEQETSAQI